MADIVEPSPPTPALIAPGVWSRLCVGGRDVEIYTIGQGIPVLFLHGWGLSPRSYKHAIAALAARGYRVIAPTLPGFGRSTPLPVRRQNVDGVAEHIAAVLTELDCHTPIDVVAHSFGGGVAMRLASTNPQLVRSLTLVCPVGGAGNGVTPLAKMATGILLESRNLWAGLAVGEVATALARHPSSVLAAAYSAWRSDQLVDLQTLRANRIPTRFLFADQDTVVSPGSIPEHVFDHITSEVIHGHHSWLISNPDAFAERAADHLTHLRNPAA